MGVYDGTLGNRNREGARTCSSMIMRDKQGGGFFFSEQGSRGGAAVVQAANFGNFITS